jgi:hypothetical protein
LKIDFDHVIGEEGECNRKDQGFYCVMEDYDLLVGWFDLIVLFKAFEKQLMNKWVSDR